MIPYREVLTNKRNHLSQGKSCDLHRAPLEGENRSTSTRTLMLYRVPQRVQAALLMLNPGERRAHRAGLHPLQGRGQEPGDRSPGTRARGQEPGARTTEPGRGTALKASPLPSLPPRHPARSRLASPSAPPLLSARSHPARPLAGGPLTGYCHSW